jgi:hypothetical protein
LCGECESDFMAWNIDDPESAVVLVVGSIAILKSVEE